MKRTLILLGLLGLQQAFAQTGKVGVNTNTPTEVLDVNGRLRVRNIPMDKTANAISTDSNGNGQATDSQNFDAKWMLVANDQGVVGKISRDNPTPTNFNDSKSMFVIRRYFPGDWANGANNTGYDTGMNVDTWEAIMTAPGHSYTKTDGYNVDLYRHVRGQVGWFLYRGNTTWRIFGDLSGIQESPIIDILFIKKDFVTVDSERRKP